MSEYDLPQFDTFEQQFAGDPANQLADDLHARAIWDDRVTQAQQIPLSERNPHEYATRLQKAHLLVETAQANGAVLDFDSAHTHISRFRDTQMKCPLVGKMLPSDTPINEMSPETFFGFTETLDVILSFGEPDDRLKAACLVTEMEGTKLYWTNGLQKVQAWEGNLGLSGDLIPDAQACAESIVSRYFSQDDGRTRADMVDTILTTSRLP